MSTLDELDEALAANMARFPGRPLRIVKSIPHDGPAIPHSSTIASRRDTLLAALTSLEAAAAEVRLALTAMAPDLDERPAPTPRPADDAR